jgi:hypothetical protein
VKQSERDKHVVFELQGFSDGGSTPPASKISLREILFLSEPSIQGASKGKIVMFYAYILRCSDNAYHVGILTQCASGTSGPHTGYSLSFRRQRRSLQQRHPLRTLRDISRTHQDSEN